MYAHRVVHDFGELSYEDLNEISAEKNRKISLQTKLYQFLFAALALGLFVGYLAKRK
jgi:hypothetical protein